MSLEKETREREGGREGGGEGERGTLERLIGTEGERKIERKEDRRSREREREREREMGGGRFRETCACIRS